MHSFQSQLSVHSMQGVFEIDKEKGMTLVEIADDVEVSDVVMSTGCDFEVSL